MAVIKAIWPLLIILPLFSGILGGINRKEALKISSVGISVGLLMTIPVMFLLKEPLILQWQWAEGILFGFILDRISIFLVFLVYLITLLVQLFSMTYMERDEGVDRYTAKLGFFAFSMIGLLMSDQMVTVFFFWELVGLSSYLLIGFWYHEIKRSDAARQAFMINRVADVFLLIGVVRVYINGYSQSFSELFSGSAEWDGFTGLCFIIAAFGKSAQFPFYGWLTKAMAGPTPVSALIHAATMVTAGVYLLVRIEPVLIDWNLEIVAVVGGVTAFMAALAAMQQFDIKRILAYSTISQLGYMMIGIGVGSPDASIFHLWTHAFFKAGLFLAAGSIIHYMHQLKPSVDAQDMRNMGGLKDTLPYTFYTVLICGLALSGLPFFSGFLSKEVILSGAVGWGETSGNYLVAVLAFLTAGLTAFYMARLILLVFFNQKGKAKVIIEPWVTVRIPLLFLAVATLWFWNTINPIDPSGWYWSDYLFASSADTVSQSQIWIAIASSVIVLIGLGIAYWFYRPDSIYSQEFYKSKESKGFPFAVAFNGWYVEKLYDLLNLGFAKVATLSGWIDIYVIDRLVDGFGVIGVVISKLIGWFDQYIVDGFVNAIAAFSQFFGRLFAGLQSPMIQRQIGWLLLTLLVLLLWFLFLA